MDPFVKKAGLSRNFLVGVSALLVGALVIGGIAMFYTSYKRSGGIPSGDIASAHVAISNPQNGAQLEIGEYVIVEVNAIGSNPYTSIELWLDGALVGVQGAPEGGMQPFAVQFSWQPLNLGARSLIAAAVDINGEKAMSAQVVVFVIQGENEIELVAQNQDGSSIVSPALPQGEHSPPEAPGVGVSTGPASNWSGSLGNWVNSLTSDEKPAAPDLVARPMECGANLLIHDLSDNEEGFIVYRQMANSPTWIILETLSSQSKVEWIEFVDDEISGIVTYYVLAFNSQGETHSNLAQVNIDPGGCPTEPENSFAESINMTLKLPEVAAEKVYCYQSRDGVNWARWPITGFLSPDVGGILPEGPIAVQIINGFDNEQGSTPLGLFMDCWGWQGGALSRLGGFSVMELEPDFTGKQLIVGEGLSAEIVFSEIEIKNLAGLLPTQLNLMDFNQLVLPSNRPASPDIPRVNLSVTSDRFICIMHLPNTIQGGADQLEFCYLYPAHDPVNGSTIPQPYLVWDFDAEPVCVGGASEECKTYPELLDLAEENGGQVGFTIQSLRGGNKTVWNVTDPNLTMFVVPPIPCLGETLFNVRMWYRPGNKGVSVSASPENQVSEIGEDSFSPPETFYGPYSNWVTVPCISSNLPSPSLATMVQYYDFTFDVMTLSQVDDDDHLATEVVELYGYFYARGKYMGYWVEEPCYFSGFDNCYDNNPPELIHAASTRYLLVDDWKSSGVDYISGSYALELKNLCLSTTRGSCSYEGQDTYRKKYNNTIRAFFPIDQVEWWNSLWFGVRLVDYDEASHDDELCNMNAYFNVGYGNDSVTLSSGKTDSGYCTVIINIEKIGDPVPLVIPDFYSND